MRLAMPDAVHRLPMEAPERAVQELATIIGRLRDTPAGTAAEREAVAREAVEAARGEGAFLMAVVTPPDAAPAILTGVVLEIPPAWTDDVAERLRDSLEDVGGPDVRETITLDTGLGPAVIVQRVPGVEQARERRPLSLQLQAFIAEPGTDRMLLLTLASPATDGWASHQLLFGELVASASAAGGSVEEEESFEHHTYRLG
ncbi:MAG TPA: hypothetical protein VGX25_22145 [Actinophytocola sp.]|uniref:hypothetical protein n=1 Tax=Actinophytocola sp. TaxID=1872138 RepID=UPI002DDCED6F|nr:hypothetical protein [Actinophytocola sp.]HEV2782102.1 hypothetical protein [Actinophytocola sp.]